MILSACGGEATEADCAEEDVLCVGLVTDVGEVDDKSFNQSAWEGVQQARDELGAIVNYVETKDAKDYMANMHCSSTRTMMSSSPWASPWAPPPLKLR